MFDGMVERPKNVDDYLAAVESLAARASLERLRAIIWEEIPDAEEVISYGIPTYKHHGFLASFAAFKNHCSFFPGHTVAQFAEELKGYKIAKGTIQFPHGELLPEDLIRSIIRARLADNLAPEA